MPDVIRDFERVDAPPWSRRPRSTHRPSWPTWPAAVARCTAASRRWRPSMRFAGPALTVEVRPGDNLMIHAALALAQPGDVW
jgi:4-hydroxy-4-methyl-2-oxoglutarate aldolase